MFDDALRLQENPHLLSLLSHYAQMGAEDRTAWQDRLMQMEGVEPRQLSALHGELIAFDWIEQNAGQAILRQDGTLSSCYRITVNGLREYCRIHDVENDVELSEPVEKPQARFPRKRKQKSDLPVALAVVASEVSLAPAS